MHLIRILLVCLGCLAAALAPSRAATACPMQAGTGLVHTELAHPAGALHHHDPRDGPAPMTCCVSTAAHLATPAIAMVRAWRPAPRPIASHDRARADAALARLLRPPTSA